MIHVLENIGLKEQSILSLSEQAEVKTYLGPIDSKIKSDIKGIYSGLSYNLDHTFLSQYPNLRFIASPTTALTHIDKDYCEQNSIRVLSLKNKRDLIANFTSTVEIAWWHMLELNRQCSSAQKSVLDGNWNRNQFFTTSLNNKKIGIIGFGRLGKKMGEIANSFNMKVYAYDIAFEGENSVHFNYQQALSINEIFEKCDFVSIHVDDRKENANLISKQQFDLIKNEGLIIINTSRGFVINESDAIEALKIGKLKGLGIDVLIDEDRNDKSKNWVVENLIVKTKKESNLNISITPHIGGATIDSLTVAAEAIFNELLQCVSTTS